MGMMLKKIMNSQCRSVIKIESFYKPLTINPILPLYSTGNTITQHNWRVSGLIGVPDSGLIATYVSGLVTTSPCIAKKL